jgi:hypothetical protein
MKWNWMMAGGHFLGTNFKQLFSFKQKDAPKSNDLFLLVIHLMNNKMKNTFKNGTN